MKKNLIAILLVLSSVSCYSQKFRFDQVNEQLKGLEFDSYLASDNAAYNVGDTLTIGVPSSNKVFAFIWMGDGIITPLQLAPVSISGTTSVIKSITVTGSKRQGYKVWFKTKAYIGTYKIDFEQAIATGEIKSSGYTSDEALSTLKKARDKLDLGIITQHDYDSIKVELVKYIK